MQFTQGQHIHFVGIGGAGLSAIARILLERGFRVSGSDHYPNVLTDALAHDGATVYAGHDAAHIQGADMVIISSAIKDNPEIEAARAAGIPIYKRQDIMAALMDGLHVIAVAGTHGKTTTTALITHLMRETGFDPSYIVGGIMSNTKTNAGVGKGDIFVIEADEYDNMFLGLRPDVIVLTSLEYDHPDFFKSPQDMVDSFRRFVDLLRPNGHIFANIDDPLMRVLLDSYNGLVGTYGFSENALYRAANIYVDMDGYTVFDVLARDVNQPEHTRMGTVRLALPGRHNVLNALAALFTATIEGIGRPNLISRQIYDALEIFTGTGRRFEVRGQRGGVIVIDDYAHHPTAIKATLSAARERYAGHSIWAVWQPHTFSRTRELLEEYALAFDAADHVIVTDLYPARELPPEGVTTTQFTAGIVSKIQHRSITHAPTFDQAVDALQAAQEPAVIVIMSAGDAPQVGIRYLEG